MNKIAMFVIVLVFSIGSATAETITDIYADMDAKLMGSNITVFNRYASDAVVIQADGSVKAIKEMREQMAENIRSGIKVEVAQSKILEHREIRTGFTGKLIAAIVISEDYRKYSGPPKKDGDNRKSREATFVSTRVFDVTKNDPIIISEHSTISIDKTKRDENKGD